MDQRQYSLSERSDVPPTGTAGPRGRSSPRGLGFEFLYIKILCEADARNNQSTDKNEVAITHSRPSTSVSSFYKSPWWPCFLHQHQPQLPSRLESL